ncbi:MAG: DNA methyltransferase [Thermoplasmata archaeon]|nr:DNA methyltransferase [Thermoplasmata archaeon]
MFILGLSGEHERLPVSEVKGILEGEGIGYRIFRYDPLILDAESISPVLERAALVKFGAKVIGEIDNLEDFHLDLNGKTFSIRFINFSDSNEDRMYIERYAGSKAKGKVNLKNPEIRIGLVKIDKIYITEILERKDPLFKERINQVRPFKTNLALQPKMARMLVNLARVKRNDLIADPFCGGGSILIEAGLMGIRSIGIDSSEKMVNGCKINLDHYGIDANIYLGDFSIIKNFQGIDAIVTDPPYGRGSTTNKENVKKLYERMFKIFREVLKKNGYVSTILPSLEYKKIAEEYFKIVEINEMKVHRSLTRYFITLS